MARIRMAVIKCVPLVPGLSTRPIGFTYESHAPTSFHRSHPPFLHPLRFIPIYPTTLSSRQIFPSRPCPAENCAENDEMGEKISNFNSNRSNFRRERIGSDSSLIFTFTEKFIRFPPSATPRCPGRCRALPTAVVGRGCGMAGRQDRETTLSRNPRRLHKTWRGYREKGRGGTRGVKYERLGGPRRDGTTGGGGKEGEAANG